MGQSKLDCKDLYMGLIMSTESQGLDIDRLDKAVKDWESFYNNEVDTNFSNILCFLICESNIDDLHRISKGFPEHVRLYCERQILENKDLKDEK